MKILEVNRNGWKYSDNKGYCPFLTGDQGNLCRLFIEDRICRAEFGEIPEFCPLLKDNILVKLA